MTDTWMLLLPPLALSALLVLTHTYFGLHVLARGIIFVDLALAQAAALGASVAFLFDHEVHSGAARVYTFGAALLAGAGFAWLRRLPDKTLREVAIGCVYVVAAALSIVILSRSAPGMEELRSLLNGNILWVRWGEIARVAVVYAALALLHGVFWPRFQTLSFGEHTPPRGALLWELLFFASFAAVITLAVQLAGVLLVFAFLILPAFSAVLLARTPTRRLVLGWLLGTGGAVAGLVCSVLADLPTGPTMAVVLGLLPILAALMRGARRERRSR